MKLTRRSSLSLMAGAALAMPYISRAHAQEEPILNIFNWNDYIGETTIEDFQSATGILVAYDFFESNEAMEARIMAGRTGFDVVAQAGSTLQRFNEAKVYQPLDRSKLTNWGNLDPVILKTLEGWDPGNVYGAPYMWGTVGLTFNVDMVKERIPDADLTSLDILFKPENAARLADCGISILESPADVIPMTLAYLGLDPNTTNPADFDAVVKAFAPIRQYIRVFDSNNFLNAIPNKELCMVTNWAGDYATAAARAKDAGIDINLAYHVPKTGAPAWFDIWCIPAEAKHVGNAHKFINFMLEPEVIAKCTNFTHYANANLAATKFVDPAILTDPAVYPDDEVRKRLWTQKPLRPDVDRVRNEAWAKIKTGSPT
ncbi:MAG TPA: polyamine ABC transporter substrate-binding protein [Aestuariivirga sp.]|nr:polyamine ABC transporter substrate-binding protein [Aestuariivirga sp.]